MLFGRSVLQKVGLSSGSDLRRFSCFGSLAYILLDKRCFHLLRTDKLLPTFSRIDKNLTVAHICVRVGTLHH